jgi:DNA-binding NtrC family response regulator
MGENHMRKYSILLVDDDPIITAGTGSDLEEKGYAVTTANSGEKAIELLNTSFFDLVITDLVMAPINGMDVLKKAKEINPETMVIILTGYGDMSSSIDALRFDADDYLLKPCEPEDICFRVSRCLEKLELERKIKAYEHILPVCCICKKIRDDSGREHGAGEWMSVENYMHRKAKVDITSTYCPECHRKAREEIAREFSG